MNAIMTKRKQRYIEKCLKLRDKREAEGNHKAVNEIDRRLWAKP